MIPSPPSGRILVVDDESPIRIILRSLLESQGFEVMDVEGGVEALNVVNSFKPHVAIVDLQMPRMDGIEVIRRLLEQLPSVTCLILTAHGSIPTAVQAMKSGAYDYLTKPFENEQLLLVVRRAVERALMSEQVQKLEARLNVGEGIERILGDSAIMQELRHQIMKVAVTDATVLIEGETGVGKELAARAIHYHSKRKAGPFVVLNCAAVPVHLAESEFFGHEKGSFTGATSTRTGKFEMAHGGTLFLDEVSELSPDIQSKLLRFLQEKTVDRVGDPQPLAVDARVVAASNIPLESLAAQGRFRRDLYHRLDVVRLSIPSLREHPQDIGLYANNTILRASAGPDSKVRFISGGAIELLRMYSWPGNIRELDHVILRAMVFARTDTLEIGDIKGALPHLAASPGSSDAPGLQDQVHRIADEAERRLIVETLEKTGWNKAAAAELLNMSRQTLYSKIEKYCLDPNKP